jgi:regulatory protein
MAESSKTSAEKVYDKALVFLRIRPHSSGELRRKLSLRGFDKDLIERALATITSQGLLNDGNFAAEYLDSLIRLKTFGYYGLMAKLLQRGIPKHDAEKLLREKLTFEVEKQIAQRLVAKGRIGDKLKLMGKLSRKGFRSDVIRAVIGEYEFDD